MGFKMPADTEGATDYGKEPEPSAWRVRWYFLIPVADIFSVSLSTNHVGTYTYYGFVIEMPLQLRACYYVWCIPEYIRDMSYYCPISGTQLVSIYCVNPCILITINNIVEYRPIMVNHQNFKRALDFFKTLLKYMLNLFI